MLVQQELEMSLEEMDGTEVTEDEGNTALGRQQPSSPPPQTLLAPPAPIAQPPWGRLGSRPWTHRHTSTTTSTSPGSQMSGP